MDEFSLTPTSISFIVEGAWVTLQYAAVSVVFGLILGTLLALCKISRARPLLFFAQAYTSLFRGTPLLLQLFFMYYALPGLTGVKLSIFAAGVLAFSLNSAAYVSEVIKAGVCSLDKGQFEAAHALGISYWKMMCDIILPQALRNIQPSLVNEMINLLKESAIISTIGGADLLRRANLIASSTYDYFGPLIVAGVCYYTLVLCLSYFAHRLEKRMQLPA